VFLKNTGIQEALQAKLPSVFARVMCDFAFHNLLLPCSWVGLVALANECF